MKSTLVYDLPTRLFHWLFAAAFLGAFSIAKTIDDESPIFSYHMLIGLVLTAMVGFRILWGFVGSRYARFSSFALKPKDLILYFKNLVSSKTKRMLGHNPASSWSALIMMALVAGLGVSGYLMASNVIDKEAAEEVHELMANALVITVIAHVAGVIFHSLRHKDWIGLSMINGKKQEVDGETGIQRSHAGIALLFALGVGALVFHLNRNYDPDTRSLKLFGNTLQLGEE